MIATTESWEARLAAHWQELDAQEPEAFISGLQLLLAELPANSPIARFELGSAHDSTGNTEQAVRLYEAALQAGLSGPRRRRAVIQLASSLRSLGEPVRSVALLTAELEGVEDALTPAVRAFLALSLADIGREREALAIALTALSGYLPRYNRSLARYARQLAE